MSGLNFRTKFGYAVGHVLNDLCSAMWFTYLLIYFHHVLLFNNTLAGVVLLIGQVADGISTPFVGHEADRTDDTAFCGRYGRKKTWHLAGTICVLCAFPFIFLGCLGCSASSDWAQVIYYSPFVIIFQFGWAATQISHLALIPSLTQDPHSRTELNALRYGFTVMSNITVYLITWLVMGLDSTNPNAGLGPEDAGKFRIIVFTVLAVGILFSSIFHILVKESNNNDYSNMVNEDAQTYKEGSDELDTAISPTTPLDELSCPSSDRIKMKSTDWLKNFQFYQVAVLYMGTRLFCNLTQAYVPIYLQDSLKLPEEAVAYIPLVMYVSGFITTTVLKALNKFIGRKFSFLLGCLLGMSSCIWVWYGYGEQYRHYWLYVVAAMMGSGASIMLVTSLSITADLIGPCVESGAFVYGAMSFTDKLSNGIAVILIQHLNPCTNCCPKCAPYYRDVIFYYCGGAAVLCGLALLTIFPVTIGSSHSKKEEHPESSQKETAENGGTVSVIPAAPSTSTVSTCEGDDDENASVSAQVHTVDVDFHGDVRARVMSHLPNENDGDFLTT